MDIEFKTIDGYPKYLINRDGIIKNSRGKEKIAQKNSGGYLGVTLYNNGEGSKKRIHRLVAEAFIPNPDNKPDINHKDGNKTNNSVDNLEWVTKSENMLHAYQTGLNKPHASYGMLGHKNPNAGRKGYKVRIIETDEVYNTITKCAEAIDGEARRISDCINGMQHTHKGYHYERV